MTAAMLTYGQARSWQRTNAVRMAEVPVEHAVSLPLPTRRWGGAGYAQFAAPAVRLPEQPVQNGAPDRWWVFDAQDGRLHIYACTSAVPFAAGQTFGAVALPPVTGTLDELRRKHGELDAALAAVIEDFFAERAGDPAARKHAAELLRDVIPQPLFPVYRALVPDFFAWLEAQAGWKGADR